MKRILLSFAACLLLVSIVISCSPSRHHRDEHKKYRVINEDSTHKLDVEDHMHDNQPH